MEELSCKRHGNFPQRQATLLPREAKLRALVAMSLETGPDQTTADLATTAAQHSFIIQQVIQRKRKHGSPVPCGMETCHGKTEVGSLFTKQQRHPVSPVADRNIATQLRRIRTDPAAQRILGNSCVAVVCLERLRIQVEPDQYLSMAALQPVVSLVRLPGPQTSKFWNTGVDISSSLDHAHQNGHKQNMEDSPEVSDETSSWAPTGESLDLDQSEATASSWTEPYNPDTSASTTPEQDCQPAPDTHYTLLESGWKALSEPLYLDPQPDQDMVIEIDPGPELSPLTPGQRCAFALLDHESESSCECEMEPVCEESSEGQSMDCSPTQQGFVVLSQQAEAEKETEVESEAGVGAEAERVEAAAEGDIEAGVTASAETDGETYVEAGAEADVLAGVGASVGVMESEDFCGVCLNGGELLCCDGCPKVFHLDCHIPPLISFPLGNWVCTLCRTEQDPVEMYACENTQVKTKAPYTLSNLDQRRCEKLTLMLSCHMFSAPFHEPVSPLARNYYQIIKRPMDLSLIRKKLDHGNTLHYFTPEQFVDDVLLMFKNCATFNYPDSEVAKAGRELEVFFLNKLQEMYPEHSFPLATQDRTDRSRLRGLNGKRKENYRRKRHVFSGKKYVL